MVAVRAFHRLALVQPRLGLAARGAEVLLGLPAEGSGDRAGQVLAHLLELGLVEAHFVERNLALKLVELLDQLLRVPLRQLPRPVVRDRERAGLGAAELGPYDV